MRNRTIKLDNEIYLNFTGEELARVVDENSLDIYAIYRTNTDKFVCQKINSTIHIDRYEHVIVDTIVDVVDFLGNDKLAIELYEKLDIKYKIKKGKDMPMV